MFTNKKVAKKIQHNNHQQIETSLKVLKQIHEKYDVLQTFTFH